MPLTSAKAKLHADRAGEAIVYTRARGKPPFTWHWRDDCPVRRRHFEDRRVREIESAVAHYPPEPSCPSCAELSQATPEDAVMSAFYIAGLLESTVLDILRDARCRDEWLGATAIADKLGLEGRFRHPAALCVREMLEYEKKVMSRETPRGYEWTLVD